MAILSRVSQRALWLRRISLAMNFRRALSRWAGSALRQVRWWQPICMGDLRHHTHECGRSTARSSFFSKSDWVFELFCVTRIAYFYVWATAGLQCAEARESSFPTIPILSGWTASWATTILSKFDFPQTSPITWKCFSQAFPAMFFSVNRHITKKTEKAWFLETILSVSSRNGKVIGERCVELCSFKKWNFSIMDDNLWRRFQGNLSHSDKTTFSNSGSDFSEDWKQVGTKDTLGHC